MGGTGNFRITSYSEAEPLYDQMGKRGKTLRLLQVGEECTATRT